MIYLGLVIVEILILFLLSRAVSKLLSQFMSTNFLFFLFLPGVIIHELSHLFAAAFLLVPVGEIEFSPRITDSGLKLGSVKIAKTDPIRRSLIGFAPVLVGVLILIGIAYFFSTNITFFKDKDIYVLGATALAIVYVLFAITNTMFSSKKDMEGTLEILITILIVFAIFYILGFRPSLDFAKNILTKEVVEIGQKSAVFLLMPITIDVFILGVIRVFKKR
ncbi:MAG: hypothetical protein HY424_01270 [Candidatus Levybacteria bacterium]|nr:hypothetical protein [Candidatus Levybacteria bacterium]